MRMSVTFLAMAYCLSVPPSLAQTELENLITRFSQMRNPNPNESLDLTIQITERCKSKNIPEAITWAKKTIDLGVKARSPNQLARAYELYGDLISMQGDFVQGAEYFDRAIRTLDNLKDSTSIAQRQHLLMYSGGWMTPLYSNDQKIEAGLKSAEIYTRLKKWGEAARVHHSLGIVYLNKAKHETDKDTVNDHFLITQAKLHNEEALRLYRALKNKNKIAEKLGSLGERYFYLNDPGQAMQLFLQAEKLLDNDNYITLAECKWYKALIYQSKNQTANALELVRQADALLQKAEYNALLHELYDLEMSLFREAKDYKNALASALKARKLRDENYTYQRNAHVASIQNSYENKLRDEHFKTLTTENELKQAKLNETRILLIGSVGSLAVIIVFLLIFSRQRQRTLQHERKNLELSKVFSKNLEDQLKNAQLTAARAQMDPHFIYNSINAIQNLILKENKMEAITYLNDFSKLSRQTLDHANQETVLLKDEVNFLENYLRLEQLRTNNKFSYQVDVQDADPDYDRVPTMLIQPILENAIVHGVSHRNSQGKISLSFHKPQEDLLQAIIDDDGVGRAASHTLKKNGHQSMATKLTESRLQLLNKNQTARSVPFHVEDKINENGEPLGTRITILIPLSLTV